MNKRSLTVFALFIALFCVPQAQAYCVNCQPRIAQRGPQSVGQAAPQITFAKSIEDLPVMQGLEVIADKDFFILFGDRRIAQTTLRGLVDVDQVYYFYWRTLKEMGWQDIGRNLYERAGEQLSMQVRAADRGGQTEVTFALQPTGTH